MEGEKLERVLGFPAILIITINSIMGTGVFFLPAVGASLAGPASILSWILLSLFSIYISMCFAELTSMFPNEGGIYEFCKHAYGRFWSFIIGWITLIAGNITIAMLIVGAIQYLLPFNIPINLTIGGFTIAMTTQIVKIVISLFFIVAFNYVAFRGMKTSAVMLIAFGLITIGTLLALIIPGMFHISFDNYVPFFVFPLPAIFATIFFISETFFGWETATFLAGETKDGARVVPRALVMGTIIIAVLVLSLVIVSLGVIPWESFGGSAAPLSDLGTVIYGSIGSTIFTLLVYISIIGSVAGWIVSAPRLMLAMSQDKLLFSQLAEIHPEFKTPTKAIIVQTLVTILLIIVGSGNYYLLLEILVPLVIITYSAVVFSVIVLRKKMPHRIRHYKVFAPRLGPLFVILINGFLIYMWLTTTHDASQTLALGLSFVGMGIPVFFLIALYHDPKIITSVEDLTSHFNRMFEWLFIPMWVRGVIIQSLGNVEGKRILDFGCKSGALTIPLAHAVGREGSVIGVDFSKNNIKIAMKRVERALWYAEVDSFPEVHLIHDEYQTSRVHPDVGEVDMVVSVGLLSYVQERDIILDQLYEVLPEGGRICLMEYGDFFGVIPNVAWLSDNVKIDKVFRERGFSVRVIRMKGLFWNFIVIYGVKYHDDVAFI